MIETREGKLDREGKGREANGRAKREEGKG